MDVASRERSWLAGHPSDDPRRRRILRYPNVLHPSHSLSLLCAFHVWFYRFKLMGEDQDRKTELQLGLRCQRGLADPRRVHDQRARSPLRQMTLDGLDGSIW